MRERLGLSSGIRKGWLFVPPSERASGTGLGSGPVRCFYGLVGDYISDTLALD